mmetsp:Transcript_477/g.920  ORF Transcript_477/g.920 Transcript_477/m.920 type:complete len:241 (+) Transcript_477:122-844(+)
MTFLGHAIAGSFFIGFPSFILGLTYKRKKQLGPGESLSQYIPENDEGVMRGCGIALIIATLFHISYETAGVFLGHTLHKIIMHCIIDASFTLVGIVLLVESKKRLPADSFRFALAMALYLAGVLWKSHSMMKEGVEKSQHMFIVDLCNMAAAVQVYSVLNPSNVVAYITGYTLILCQGIWLMVLAFMDGHSPVMWSIAPAFCVAILLTFAVVATMTACVHKEEERGFFTKVVGVPLDDDV